MYPTDDRLDLEMIFAVMHKCIHKCMSRNFSNSNSSKPSSDQTECSESSAAQNAVSMSSHTNQNGKFKTCVFGGELYYSYCITK